MKMFRWIWHAFFYGLAPRTMKKKALTCRDVVQQLNTEPQLKGWARLHTSMCEGCYQYHRFSRLLRKNIKFDD